MTATTLVGGSGCVCRGFWPHVHSSQICLRQRRTLNNGEGPSKVGHGRVSLREERRPRAQAAARDQAMSASPKVDVRVVLFTVAGGQLRVALPSDGDDVRLPRGTLLPNQALDSEARRIVRDTIGFEEQYAEQLYTLSLREPSGWVLVISYLGLITDSSNGASSRSDLWYPVDGLPKVVAIDRMVIEYALLRLRAKLGYTTIAFHLLRPTFTLSELQATYQAILGRPLDKRNFRRRVVAAGFLEATGDQHREGSHRPALLYRFRAAHDRETYLTPAWSTDA